MPSPTPITITITITIMATNSEPTDQSNYDQIITQ